MKIQKSYIVIFFCMFICRPATAQLFIDNATFIIQPGATVTVQGDITSNTDIQGAGKVLLKGAALQNINMAGFTIPNLEIDNALNATLTSNTKIGGSLLFTTGKIILGANNLTLADVATVSGQGTGKFIETDGTGQVIKNLAADVAATEIPIGLGTSYRPAFITSTGTYSSAAIGVKVVAQSDISKPPMISDYLAVNWPISKTGVTGTVTVAGQYLDVTDFTGTETNLRGYFYDGTDWSSAGETHDVALHRVGAPVTAATGEITGLDKFTLTKAKVFLQGAYNTTTGVMSDALRTPTNLIPLTAPYRNAPYNFVEVANPTAETAAASVFADQSNVNNNIVDWVFVELRNSTVSPGNTVLQTRSALLKRDGNIVDVDGISPVTFNNTPNGNYTIAVRHRNHLGMSADPATNLLALDEKKSTAVLLDLTTAGATKIYGTAAAFAIGGGKNLLWAGNANSNTNVKFVGLANDKDFILINTLGNNPAQVISNVYSPADLNMNGVVRFVGLNNDKDLLLINVLANTPSNQTAQALPN